MEVLTGKDLGGLEGTWQQLVREDPAATAFQTWEWNREWWRQYGGNRSLLVLVAFCGSRPTALAPLALRPAWGGMVRQIEFLGTGVSDYLGLIGASETMAECARAFVERLWELPGWDVVDLQQLNPRQRTRCGWSGAMVSTLAPGARLTPQATCPVMVLPAKFDELLAKLGKKMRWNLRYSGRLLEREFTVTFDDAGQETVLQHLDDFFRLHAKRWRRRCLPGAIYSRRLRAFHQGVAPALAQAGYLALFRLLLDGHCVAALYGFRFNQALYYYLGGFDPQYARYSPGTVLIGYAVRRAIEWGCEEFDFLRGRESYKYRWPVEERENARLEIPRTGSVRARLGMAANAVLQRAEERLKRALGHENSDARNVTREPVGPR